MPNVREELNQCIKAKVFIRLGWHVADARLALRRAQNQLLKVRRQRSVS